MSPKEVTAIPPLPRPRDWPRSSAEKVGTALAARRADLGRQGPLEALAHARRQGHGLAVAVDLDGLAGGVHHQVAVLAVLEVLFELAGQTRVQLAVQVVAELVDYAFAVQSLILGPSPPFRSSQNFPSRCPPPGSGFS